MFKVKNSGGFTLLETILVLGVALSASVLALQKAQHDFKRDLAETTAQQIATIGEATESYMTNNYQEWPNNPAVTPTIPGPGASCSGDLCTITLDTLISEGYLPNWNPSAKTPFGADFDIKIKRTYISSMPVLNALVVTNKPYTNSNSVEYGMLGHAVETIGQRGGIIRRPLLWGY